MNYGELLVNEALATEGAQEVPAGSNAGPYVKRLLLQVGLKPGQPWCAAQVYDWGKKALGKLWPLPKTGSCYELGEWAESNGVLVKTPTVGMVGLIWEPSLKRFGHALVVVSLPNLTISGNTTKPGQAGNAREGWCVALKPWRAAFAPEDRFINWMSKVVQPSNP